MTNKKLVKKAPKKVAKKPAKKSATKAPELTPFIDPNAKATGDGIFGLPFTEERAKVVYIPVPWDATTSYGYGTHKGPDAIRAASAQMDLFDMDYLDPFAVGLFMRETPKDILALNKKARGLAEKIIKASDEKLAKDKTLQSALKQVNHMSGQLNMWVYLQCQELLSQGKMPVVVGGDHSVPFGAIRAYAEKYPGLGILHIDAHSDTRVAYMGFEHSHASIMYNVLEKIPNVGKLVQVGIRDFCEQEYEYTKARPSRVKVFDDKEVSFRQIRGEPFANVALEIVDSLPENVYLSFDIDGLDPKYCPNTGTPVAGGLEFNQLLAIIKVLIESGRKLVGFDLVEVAPGKNGDEWDANVGMRLLYKLTAAALGTQGLVMERE